MDNDLKYFGLEANSFESLDCNFAFVQSERSKKLEWKIQIESLSPGFGKDHLSSGLHSLKGLTS